MGDKVQACPECDSTVIVVRSGGVNQHPIDGDRWLCRDCGADFSAPERRDRRDGGTAGLKDDTLAGQLDEMDPDEIGGSA
jgi:DNA-directed RNA polymerase subunit RPC12/RpoP